MHLINPSLEHQLADGRLDVQLDHFCMPKAATASLDPLLRRSGAEQKEMIALHHAAARSAKQHSADANHASLKGSRNESNNESTCGADTVPVVWDIAWALATRLATAARLVSAWGEQRGRTHARPPQGAEWRLATASKEVAKHALAWPRAALLRCERHRISPADLWRREPQQLLRCGRRWHPSAPSLMQRLSTAAARLAPRAFRFSARCFLVAAVTSGQIQTSQPCPRSS